MGQHVERYRNSPVMHESIPDEGKPIVLNAGVRMPFPLPTTPLLSPSQQPCKPRLRPRRRRAVKPTADEMSVVVSQKVLPDSNVRPQRLLSWADASEDSDDGIDGASTR